MNKSGYKFRLYPTNAQKQVLAQEFGCARVTYNQCLSNAKETGNFNWLAESKGITKRRSEVDWYGARSRTVQDNSLGDLKDAYNRMFKKQNKYPNFKSRSNHQSIRFSEKTCRVGLSDVYVSKALGPIKCKITRKLDAPPKQITISKTPDGKYFCSFCCDRDVVAHQPNKLSIGLDLGLTSYVTLSDGTKIDNPKWMKNKQLRLVRYQRKYSKNKLLPKSNRKTKSRIKVASVHQQVVNARLDFQHKLSTNLIRKYQIITCEDLAVCNMVKNRKLSKSIQQAGWSNFIVLLKYKADWYGRHLVKVDRFYPSSKTCSSCGTVRDTLTLKEREWKCVCGSHHDRDVNAAINLNRAGLAQMNAQGEVWTSANCEETVVNCNPDTMYLG